MPDPRLWILRQSRYERIHPIVRELLPPKQPSSAFKKPRVIDYESVASRLFEEIPTYPHCIQLFQCLHMALMRTDVWNPQRFVNPHLFEPQCLREMFQLFGYTTLHKRVPLLNIFGIIYRKAFPAKRQPRHWHNTCVTTWKDRAVRIHLTELGTWFHTNMLLHKPAKVTLEDHRRWAHAYYKRMDADYDSDVLSFYTSHQKESLVAVCCFFERVMRPFHDAWGAISPAWTSEYLPKLGSISDIDVFNSLMAALGPRCLVPLSFWETVFQILGTEPCDISSARDPWVMSAVAQHDKEGALRFLRLLGDEPTIERVVPLIDSFYDNRMGPSVLKSILLKKLNESVRTKVKQLAWQWFSAFGSYYIPWPENLELIASEAILGRYETLGIPRLSTFGRRLQLCLNCGLVHTVHNVPAAFKVNTPTVVYDAHKTVGVTGAAYDVLYDKSVCGRQNSTISINCKKTEASCFNVVGWTYHNYTCFFICVQCGIVGVWDLSTCKFVREGPLCSHCSLSVK